MCNVNPTIMMRKYFTYALLLGPLLGAQNKETENSVYQQNWVVSEKENEALAFDADIRLSESELTLDKKTVPVKKTIPWRNRKTKNPFI